MSGGHSKTRGYRVEARITFRHSQPVMIEDQHLTESWRRLAWPRGTVGVPNRIWDTLADQHGVLTYEAAMALTAWAAAALPLASVEFRLVRVYFETTWKETEDGVSAAFDFDSRERAEVFAPDSSTEGCTTRTE